MNTSEAHFVHPGHELTCRLVDVALVALAVCIQVIRKACAQDEVGTYILYREAVRPKKCIISNPTCRDKDKNALFLYVLPNSDLRVTCRLNVTLGVYLAVLDEVLQEDHCLVSIATEIS